VFAPSGQAARRKKRYRAVEAWYDGSMHEMVAARALGKRGRSHLRLISAIGLVPLRIPVSLIVLTGVAWAVMLHHAISMNEPLGFAAHDPMCFWMSHKAGVGGLGVFVAVWTVMMAAMMLPSAAPMILTYAAAQARRYRNVAVPTWMFVTGYLLVWAYSGLVVYLLICAGQAMVDRMAWLENGAWAPLALGVTLTLAGLYQFTPLKRLCLRHCRSPLAFLRRHWHDGWERPVELGGRHGLHCLGCCWAFFGVMVAAAGTMNFAWMVLITLVVFAEKVLPHGSRISAVVALGLIALGLLVGSGTVDLGG
jgi:predicted metal-binding membrane protein